MDTVWETLTAVSNYRTWNPVVNHAAIYGPVAAGTKLKIRSGKWDFDFVIDDVSSPSRLELRGKSTGIDLQITFRITGDPGISKLSIEACYGGLVPGLFRRKSRLALEESLEMFLNSLKRRAVSGGAYQVERNDDDNSKRVEEEYYPPATPFNLLYKSGSRKPPRRRSGLK